MVLSSDVDQHCWIELLCFFLRPCSSQVNLKTGNIVCVCVCVSSGCQISWRRRDSVIGWERHEIGRYLAIVTGARRSRCGRAKTAKRLCVLGLWRNWSDWREWTPSRTCTGRGVDYCWQILTVIEFTYCYLRRGVVLSAASVSVRLSLCLLSCRYILLIRSLQHFVGWLDIIQVTSRLDFEWPLSKSRSLEVWRSKSFFTDNSVQKRERHGTWYSAA